MVKLLGINDGLVYANEGCSSIRVVNTANEEFMSSKFTCGQVMQIPVGNWLLYVDTDGSESNKVYGLVVTHQTVRLNAMLWANQLQIRLVELQKLQEELVNRQHYAKQAAWNELPEIVTDHFKELANSALYTLRLVQAKVLRLQKQLEYALDQTGEYEEGHYFLNAPRNALHIEDYILYSEYDWDGSLGTITDKETL